ncbi:MAG: hypothetical protein M3437_08770 [Chloroflexota bacterium]|nr:hypothetical protein [Chloroflexota bacterium]MDQ5864521.1 hypothetical protein [Chloroflexota bacterium]
MTPEFAHRAEVGIVIPLREEFDQFFTYIKSNYARQRDSVTGAYYYYFEYPFSPTKDSRRYKCVATLLGKVGPEAAALVTNGLIQRCDPALLVMLGIAGSLNKSVKLGDVVIATLVDGYLVDSKAVPSEDGSGFTWELSGDPYQATQEIIDFATNFQFIEPEGFDRWREGCLATLSRLSELDKDAREVNKLRKRGLLRLPVELVLGHIASGQSVVSSEAFVAWLKNRDRKYMAVEMEALGFMQASHRRLLPKRALVLRGISDYSDERKGKLDAIGEGICRRFAMRNATELLWAFLDTGELPFVRNDGPGVGDPVGTGAPPDLTDRSPPTSNLAFLRVPTFATQDNKKINESLYDIGAIWGLNRTSFVGLLAGTDEGRIYAALRSSERILQDVMSEDRSTALLPKRRWTRLDAFNPYPGGPATEQHVWDSAAAQANSANSANSANRPGHEDSLGFFFGVRTEELDEGLQIKLSSWCDALVTRVFPQSDVAIVICLTTTPGYAGAGRLQELKARLEARQLPVPIELLVEWERASNLAHTEDHRPFAATQVQRPGIHLCRWLQDIEGRGAAELRDAVQAGEFPATQAEYARCVDLAVGTADRSSAKQLVDDLDELLANNSVDFDHELLKLVARFIPERLCELISAYAGSSRVKAQREALLFASSWDPLMDAWLAGIPADYRLTPMVLKPDTGEERVSFVGSLLLATLRMYKRDGTTALRHSISELKPLASPHLRPLCDLFLGATRWSDLLEKCPDATLMFAIRAGPSSEAAINIVNALDLDRSAPWRLLAAMPPSSEILRRLLTLPAASRAVFGLCTAAELKALSPDEELIEKIIWCRGNRSLVFRQQDVAIGIMSSRAQSLSISW